MRGRNILCLKNNGKRPRKVKTNCVDVRGGQQRFPKRKRSVLHEILEFYQFFLNLKLNKNISNAKNIQFLPFFYIDVLNH